MSDSIKYYDDNAEEFYENTINIDMSSIYDKFCAKLPSNAKILDAGCGVGRDSKAFMDMGHDVTSFDASVGMVKKAFELTRGNVTQSTFENFDTKVNFDGIWCCASLLHVTIDELPKTIERMVFMLKPHGIIYISFKYGNNEREVDGRNFIDLNEKRLSSVMNKIKHLKVEDVWKTADSRKDRDDKWLNAILSRD